jgi:hypothetical protein
MLLVILTGIVYVLLTESLAVAVITASLILYRAQRPSQFRNRLREWRYAQAASQVGDE